MERDKFLDDARTYKIISTHTLTWSVTRHLLRLLSVARISTHTLTWSVTRPHSKTYITFWISTHTLTWSVTKPCRS